MNKPNTLKTWLLSGPIFFALISFLFLLIVTFGIGLILPANDTSMTAIGILLFVSIIGAAILTFRRLPKQNLDRPSFISIYNAQTAIIVLASLASLISAIYITPIELWLFSLIQTTPGIVLSIFIVIMFMLVSLYIAGVALCGFWAKLWRGIDMKIPLWKIILSVPFGFTMTWVPGYFLPEKTTKKPTVSVNTSWYANLTKWILSRPSNACISFVVLMGLSGFIAGFMPLLLSLTMIMLFALWVIYTGQKQFIKNIGGTYANVAIAINFAMLIYVFVFAYLLH